MSMLLLVFLAATCMASVTGIKVGDGPLSAEWLRLIAGAFVIDAARLFFWLKERP
jgi:hypothetical protein